MQGSDYFFFFFSPTLSGSWFSLPVLAEPLSPLDAAEGAPERGRHSGAAGTPRSQQRQRQVGDSTSLGMRCRVRGHTGYLGASRNPERSLGRAPAPSRPGLACA